MDLNHLLFRSGRRGNLAVPAGRPVVFFLQYFKELRGTLAVPERPRGPFLSQRDAKVSIPDNFTTYPQKKKSGNHLRTEGNACYPFRICKGLKDYLNFQTSV